MDLEAGVRGADEEGGGPWGGAGEGAGGDVGDAAIADEDGRGEGGAVGERDRAGWNGRGGRWDGTVECVTDACAGRGVERRRGERDGG